MTTLIVTTDASAAGNLKQSRIADRVAGELSLYCLVTGPVPAVSDPIAFFTERAKFGGPELRIWEPDDMGAQLIQDWIALVKACGEFDRVEIWPNPDPNSQLQLLQLLDWLGRDPAIAPKLRLTKVDVQLGEHKPAEITALGSVSQELSSAQFDLADIALRAFQQSTPEAWFALLREDLDALPYLRSTVLRMLEELPAADTALTASETKLLETISAGPTEPSLVFVEHHQHYPQRVLGHWEIGKALDHLAHCEAPAVLGLAEGPFTLELHDDVARYNRYKNSQLSLSELGRALARRHADFSRYNRIDRWWGGTRLTNDRLWRWDARAKDLVAPS
jgi:hypothetical protein